MCFEQESYVIGVDSKLKIRKYFGEAIFLHIIHANRPKTEPWGSQNVIQQYWTINR